VTAWAVASRELWFLNFVHVSAGVLWTGIDLFMGFAVGPVLRRIGFEHRRAFTLQMMPITLYLMTTLSIITTTAGWYLADEMGYLALDYPDFWWVVAALAIVAVLTAQGLCLLLPINIMALLELRKENFDRPRVERLVRNYIWIVASQGTMQVGILIVMSRFGAGL
jgi:hypothetical protein